MQEQSNLCRFFNDWITRKIRTIPLATPFPINGFNLFSINNLTHSTIIKWNKPKSSPCSIPLGRTQPFFLIHVDYRSEFSVRVHVQLINQCGITLPRILVNLNDSLFINDYYCLDSTRKSLRQRQQNSLPTCYDFLVEINRLVVCPSNFSSYFSTGIAN